MFISIIHKLWYCSGGYEKEYILWGIEIGKIIECTRTLWSTREERTRYEPRSARDTLDPLHKSFIAIIVRIFNICTKAFIFIESE